jgi:nitrite reductase/ring-hydroxylating ferredoxin subunit
MAAAKLCDQLANYLCASKVVQERNMGFSFRVSKEGRIWPAFIIRFEGEVKAYLNVCAHAGLRLEGGSGQFFSRDSQQLACTSHGAIYKPDTGLCHSGPCIGLSLISLNVIEKAGSIYFDDEEYKYHDEF